jgi:hypothetical protein
MRFKISATILCVIVCLPAVCFGQENSKFGLGVGFGASSLGYHFDGALRVTEQSNFRGAFNFLNYNKDTSRNGIDYAAKLGLRSLQFTYEQYIYKGFHVGGGVLAYNGNHADGDAAVPAGKFFARQCEIFQRSDQSYPRHSASRFRTCRSDISSRLRESYPAQHQAHRLLR